MNQLSASKSFTVTTLQDGKDGRDATDIVVSPQTIAYPAIEGWSLWEAYKYYVSVQYTDKDNVIYDRVTNIVSYTAPEGIVLESTIYVNPYTIQVSIPSHTAEVGAVSAVVDLENSDGSKTVQNIPCSFNIIQKNPDYTDLGNVYYAANSQGKALDTTTYFVTSSGNDFKPHSVSKLYGPSNARMIAGSTAFLVEVTQGEDVRGLILFRGTLRKGDTYIRIERQFTLVPEVTPTTYNPDFSDRDQTLADDCSDTICITDAWSSTGEQVERWLYLPDVSIWKYRKITIYRYQYLSALSPVGQAYNIYIGPQNNGQIYDLRRRNKQTQTLPGFNIGVSYKVSFWSDGNYWYLVECSEMDTENNVVLE